VNRLGDAGRSVSQRDNPTRVMVHLKRPPPKHPGPRRQNRTACRPPSPIKPTRVGAGGHYLSGADNPPRLRLRIRPHAAADPLARRPILQSDRRENPIGFTKSTSPKSNVSSGHPRRATPLHRLLPCRCSKTSRTSSTTRNHEDLFDDFARPNRLWPRKLSQAGPGIAWFGSGSRWLGRSPRRVGAKGGNHGLRSGIRRGKTLHAGKSPETHAQPRPRPTRPPSLEPRPGVRHRSLAALSSYEDGASDRPCVGQYGVAPGSADHPFPRTCGQRRTTGVGGL